MPQLINRNEDGSWEYQGQVLKEIPANGLVWNHVDQYGYRILNDYTAEQGPYTFERAGWSGPWYWAPVIGVLNIYGQSVSGALNPFNFATQETAVKILAEVTTLVRGMSGGWVVELVTQPVVGPFTRTTERSIRVWKTPVGTSFNGGEPEAGRDFEDYNAGQLAAKIVKNGLDAAMKSLRYEINLIRGQ